MTRRFGRKQDPATDTFDPTKTNYPTSQKYEAPAVEETRG